MLNSISSEYGGSFETPQWIATHEDRLPFIYSSEGLLEGVNLR